MARKRLILHGAASHVPEAGADRHFVTALARGLEVLTCFGADRRQLGNADIAARCRLPRSTVSRLTHTLTRLGYLHYAAEAGQYRLGMAALALSTGMLAQLDVRDFAGPLMQDLADFARGSVSLGVRDRLSMVYVESRRGQTPISLTLEAGSRIAVATSAMGRAFLAACTAEERAPILEELRVVDEFTWPGTSEAIDKAIEDHATLGCCCSFGDWQASVNAIAVGFRPGGGLPAMALNCGGANSVLSPEFLLGEVRPRLLALGARLQGCMGPLRPLLPSRLAMAAPRHRPAATGDSPA